MAGSLFVINIEGHYTYTVMPSQRLVSCDVIDIGNLIMCRTFGSMIVVLFRICSFAQNHELSYNLRLWSWFLVYVKVISVPPRLNRPYKFNCVRRMVTSTKHRGLLVPLLTAKGGRYGIDLVRAKSVFLFGYQMVATERKCQKVTVANSEIRWAQLVPSRTVLTLSVQNDPARSKLALKKLGWTWPLGSIWLFSFYSIAHQ